MPATSLRFTVVSGTGNRFALFDGYRDELPGDAADFARALCSDSAKSARGRLDGILLLLPGRSPSECRMIVHNADGSRPESCGNGLRCVARIARERAHVDSDAFTILSDAGPRAARVLRDAKGSIDEVEIEMGEPVVRERRITLKLDVGAIEATLVDVGNPHCVVFVSDPREVPLERLGPAVEHHRHFPSRTNVEFVAARGDHLEMRVWERGVGETLACGTGACAAAVAACITQRVPPSVSAPGIEVRLAGGVLHVRWDAPSGALTLRGGCEVEGEGTWPNQAAARS